MLFLLYFVLMNVQCCQLFFVMSRLRNSSQESILASVQTIECEVQADRLALIISCHSLGKTKVPNLNKKINIFMFSAPGAIH